MIGDNGKFNLGHYSCPGTTLFSIRYKRCVNADLSACEPLTSTTAPTETNPPQTTQASTTESPEFICESEGRFKDEQDLTCKWLAPTYTTFEVKILKFSLNALNYF